MFDYRAQRSDKIRAKGDDGDTMLLLLDLGLDVRTEQSIRLSGVLAPESYQPGGLQSAVQLRVICDDIEDRARARKYRWPFIVFTHPARTPEADEKRTFTRWVGMVYAFDHEQTGEPSINDQMVMFLAAHPEWGDGIGGGDD